MVRKSYITPEFVSPSNESNNEEFDNNNNNNNENDESSNETTNNLEPLKIIERPNQLQARRTADTRNLRRRKLTEPSTSSLNSTPPKSSSRKSNDKRRTTTATTTKKSNANNNKPNSSSKSNRSSGLNSSTSTSTDSSFVHKPDTELIRTTSNSSPMSNCSSSEIELKLTESSSCSSLASSTHSSPACRSFTKKNFKNFFPGERVQMNKKRLSMSKSLMSIGLKSASTAKTSTNTSTPDNQQKLKRFASLPALIPKRLGSSSSSSSYTFGKSTSDSLSQFGSTNTKSETEPLMMDTNISTTKKFVNNENLFTNSNYSEDDDVILIDDDDASSDKDIEIDMTNSDSNSTGKASTCTNSTIRRSNTNTTGSTYATALTSIASSSPETEPYNEKTESCSSTSTSVKSISLKLATGALSTLSSKYNRASTTTSSTSRNSLKSTQSKSSKSSTNTRDTFLIDEQINLSNNNNNNRDHVDDDDDNSNLYYNLEVDDQGLDLNLDEPPQSFMNKRGTYDYDPTFRASYRPKQCSQITRSRRSSKSSIDKKSDLIDVGVGGVGSMRTRRNSTRTSSQSFDMNPNEKSNDQQQQQQQNSLLKTNVNKIDQNGKSLADNNEISTPKTNLTNFKDAFSSLLTDTTTTTTTTTDSPSRSLLNVSNLSNSNNLSLDKSGSQQYSTDPKLVKMQPIVKLRKLSNEEILKATKKINKHGKDYTKANSYYYENNLFSADESSNTTNSIENDSSKNNNKRKSQASSISSSSSSSSPSSSSMVSALSLAKQSQMSNSSKQSALKDLLGLTRESSLSSSSPFYSADENNINSSNSNDKKLDKRVPLVKGSISNNNSSPKTSSSKSKFSNSLFGKRNSLANGVTTSSKKSSSKLSLKSNLIETDYNNNNNSNSNTDGFHSEDTQMTMEDALNSDKHTNVLNKGEFICIEDSDTSFNEFMPYADSTSNEQSSIKKSMNLTEIVIRKDAVMTNNEENESTVNGSSLLSRDKKRLKKNDKVFTPEESSLSNDSSTKLLARTKLVVNKLRKSLSKTSEDELFSGILSNKEDVGASKDNPILCNSESSTETRITEQKLSSKSLNKSSNEDLKRKESEAKRAESPFRTQNENARTSKGLLSNNKPEKSKSNRSESESSRANDADNLEMYQQPSKKTKLINETTTASNQSSIQKTSTNSRQSESDAIEPSSVASAKPITTTSVSTEGSDLIKTKTLNTQLKSKSSTFSSKQTNQLKSNTVKIKQQTTNETNSNNKLAKNNLSETTSKISETNQQKKSSSISVSATTSAIPSTTTTTNTSLSLFKIPKLSEVKSLNNDESAGKNDDKETGTKRLNKLIKSSSSSDLQSSNQKKSSSSSSSSSFKQQQQQQLKSNKHNEDSKKSQSSSNKTSLNKKSSKTTDDSENIKNNKQKTNKNQKSILDTLPCDHLSLTLKMPPKVNILKSIESSSSLSSSSSSSNSKYQTGSLTMAQLNEKRIEFSKSIGCSHPYFSLSFLMVDYLNKISAASSLDFNLLNENIEEDEQHTENGELSVNNLNRDEKLELCKLMSRSAGLVNFYKLYGFGSDLRENTTKKAPIDFSEYGKNANNIKFRRCPEFANQAEEMEFVSNEISKLTLSQYYILYKHLKERFNSPFRVVELEPDESLKITFENNGSIESTNSAIDECVYHVIHGKNGPLNKSIKSSLFSNVENEVQNRDEEKLEELEPKNAKVQQIEEAKKIINDDQLFDSMYLRTFLERFNKKHNFKNINYRRIENLSVNNLEKRKQYASCEPYQVLDTPRFEKHQTIINPNRGLMQRAEKYRFLSNQEYEYRLQKFRNQTDCDLNLNKLFNNSDV